MERVAVGSNHRGRDVDGMLKPDAGQVPVHVLHPDRELLGWLCILAITIGLVAAGAKDAMESHNSAATLFLVGLDQVLVVLYGWIAIDWVRLVSS